MSEPPLPNFLVLGAEKAGTTWLYQALRGHPDVFVPATKEAHFFNRRTSNLEERDAFETLGLPWYQRLFRGWEGQRAIGEVTPMYLCDDLAPERIARTIPQARLVCSLRNPVDRSYSHYQMAVGKGHVDVTFQELVERDDERFIRRSDYAAQLATYLELFPAEQVHVLFFEELFESPDRALAGLAGHLDLEPFTSLPYEAENAASRVRSTKLLRLTTKAAVAMRHRRGLDSLLDLAKRTGVTVKVKEANRASRAYPPLDPEVRRTLARRFEPSVRELESLLRRPVPWSL